MSKGVELASAEYVAMAKEWDLPDALIGGTATMRAGGKKWLPQEPAETTKAYRVKLERAFLFNAYGRTVNRLSGMPFKKTIALGDDMPDDVKGWCENIDNAGRNLSMFARDALHDQINHGLTHVMAEMPVMPENATLADQRAMNARPYLVHIRSKNMIGWRWTLRDGKPFLTQARIQETAKIPDGEFGEVEVRRIRVLEPGRFRVYQEPATPGDDWTLAHQGKTTLDFIPLATAYARRTGFMTAAPPLADLAWLNLEHYQSSADQRNILHVARVPILFGKGLSDEVEIEIGPNSFIRGPADGDLKFVEHEGAAIEAGREDIKAIEERMVMLGLEPLMPRPGNTTATGRAIDKAEADSDLGQMVADLQDCLELGLDYCGRYAGLKEDEAGSITIDKDFGLSLRSAEEIAALQRARVAGDITRETFLAQLVRHGYLPDDFDIKGEIERVEQEGPDEPVV